MFWAKRLLFLPKTTQIWEGTSQFVASAVHCHRHFGIIFGVLQGHLRRTKLLDLQLMLGRYDGVTHKID